MKKTRGAIVAIFVLVVGAMFVVACGGDDDAKTSATATTQQSSATVAATTDSNSDAGTTTSAATAEATTPVVATEPPSGDVASDACALLTTADVEDAFGEPTLAPEAGLAIDTPLGNGVTAAVSTCGYTSESYTSSLSITYYSAPGQNDGISGMIGLACQGHEMISGLGDTACWYDEQHVQIQMAKDGGFVDAFATTSLDAGEMLLNVMEKAACRI